MSTVGSPHVEETAIIESSIEKVWKVVRPLDFKFLPDVENVEVLASDGDKKQVTSDSVGGLRKIKYKKSTQTVKILEISDINYSITYDLIMAEPAVGFSSAVYTIKLQRVTENGSTFMSWSTDFSNDASQEILQDNKYKKLEGFGALRTHLKKKSTEEQKKA
eukprot:jgi/Bigna1/52777/estExt_Genewise1Plus.C_110101